MSWETPQPNWKAPAGQIINSFLAKLHQEIPSYSHPLTLFGSAAIQLCLDEEFTSADIDLMAFTDNQVLRDLARAAGVGRSGSLRPDYGIQICPPQLFRTTPHYLLRAQIETRHGLKIIIPHVRDILIGKLHRSRSPEQDGLVAKDRRAFFRVRELSQGHPSEQDLIEDLRLCADDLALRTTEEGNAFRLNAMDLFQMLFQRPLNIQKEILTPVSQVVAPSLKSSDVENLLKRLQPDRD